MTTAAHVFEKAKTSPVALVLIGLATIAALAASARIQVPMVPVPITFQTVVVLMMPCLLGYRMALGILAAYFMAGLLGAPVFASGAGPAYFAGPTGGYLAGFAAAVMLMGAALEYRKTWSFAALAALMLVGHAVILLLGVIWLAYGLPGLGLNKAVATGLIPFLSGSMLKSVLAAGLVKSIKTPG